MENIAETMKRQFMDAYKNIIRPGAGDLLEWLEYDCDFFAAPASSGHHGAYPGGLAEHSLNVYHRLLAFTRRDINHRGLYREEEETVAILALLHDVCKVGVYHEETKRRRNPDSGVWENYKAYSFRDSFPLGHGEKSIFLISRFMPLTNEEALAIRWHMGAYDDAVRGGSRALNAAMSATPWVWRLHEADMCATHIDERSEAQ